MNGTLFINGLILGFAAGMFVVGIFAPWLVFDTHNEAQRLLDEMEEEPDTGEGE